MGYVADFITGRSIAEQEPAVGVVIVPRTGGWPDPVVSAALDPVHPHERFSPISLPLEGCINDRGYFEPTPGQWALGEFLQMTGFQSWEQFFKKAYAGYEGAGLQVGEERKQAGFAVMRPETFDYLVTLGRRSSADEDDAVSAARILIDAQERLFKKGDNSVRTLAVALLHSPPKGNTWETLAGEEIIVPRTSFALADGYAWQLDAASRDHLRERLSDAYMKPIGETVLMFRSLANFQNLSVGLSVIGKYFTPGGFMRRDNIRAVTELALVTLNGALTNASSREATGVETREERFLQDMESVLRQIDALRATVEHEVECARNYLRIDDADLKPMSPAP